MRAWYTFSDTGFGVARSKLFNEGFMDIHVSVGKIFHMSTGFTYPVSQKRFSNTKEFKIAGHYEASKQLACSAPVLGARAETLLLLKLIPVGREKDTIDVLALLPDMRARKIHIFIKEHYSWWSIDKN